MQVIVSFLAILELMKIGFINIVQEEILDPTDSYFGKLYQAMIINRRPREKLDFDTPKNRFFLKLLLILHLLLDSTIELISR